MPSASPRRTLFPAQYLVFKISDDKKNIILDQEANTGNEKGASWDDFKGKLPDNDARYAMFDTVIQTKAGAETNKLMFVAWSDDNAPIKKKCSRPPAASLLCPALHTATSRRHAGAAPPPDPPAQDAVRLVEGGAEGLAAGHRRGVPGHVPRRPGLQGAAGEGGRRLGAAGGGGWRAALPGSVRGPPTAESRT